MSFSIVDNLGNVIVNKKDNKPLSNIPDKKRKSVEEKFADKINSGEIRLIDGSAEENYRKTTPQERADYMGNVVSGLFPNSTEAEMNDAGLGERFKAGAKDVFSMPGRAMATTMGNDSGVLSFEPPWARLAGDQKSRDEFWRDLGTRNSETEHPVGKIVRDPVNGAVAMASGPIGAFSKDAAGLGEAVAPKVGPYVGRMLAGAAVGAGTEAANSYLNDEKMTGNGAIAGAVAGGAGEVLGGAVEDLLRRNGKEFLLSIGSAARLGNTNRKLTWDEFLNLYRGDANFRKIVDLIAERESSLKGISPLNNDRGRMLTGDVNGARDAAKATLENEPILQQSMHKDILPGETVSKANDARKRAILSTPEGDMETYRNKTIYTKPGESFNDPEYEHHIGDTERFTSARLNKNRKANYQQTNDEYQLNKYAGKYEDISQMVNDANLKQGAMTPDEKALLDDLESESLGDKDVIASFNSMEAGVGENKFYGNKNRFTNDYINNRIIPFIERHNADGLTQEFKDAVSTLMGNNIDFGLGKAKQIWAFLDKDRPGIERAFAYSSDPSHNVRKGYTDAVDKFADNLSDYAEMRTGKSGENAKGEAYIVGKDKMKKYAYSYLAKVQEILEKQYALSPDDIVTLYGLATNVNDTEVQKYILQLLKDLKVDQKTIDKFKLVGGDYAMLNKAQSRMKSNSKNESNPFKGTMLAPIYPQEGINSVNAASYRATQPTFNLGRGDFGFGPNAHSTAARNGLYMLGVPFAGSTFGNSDK